uniref:Uncharacterized protein n=1 Tax=Daucus carota subsp. sativus TaxID=79200 RepID=A0A161Y1B5_DAUCS
MHCTLPRTSTSKSEEEGRKSNFQSRKFVEKENINSSPKDSSELSAGWRTHDRRCAVYLLTPEPDGQCKLVALPLGYVYHVNQLGSTTQSTAVDCPQPKNGDTGNKFLVSKEETYKKRNSGKKKKKKGKRKKKLGREIGKTGSENVPEFGASRTVDRNDINDRVIPLASATKLADLSPEKSGNENCSQGTSARDYQNTSCTKETGVSKSLTPSLVPNCSRDHHISEFGNEIQTAGVQAMPCGVSSYPDEFSERPVLCSPSPCSNCQKPNSGSRSTLCDEKNDDIKLSTSPEHCLTPCEEKNDNIKLSPSPDCVVREECPGNSFNHTVANDIQDLKKNSCRQPCHSEIPEKRVKKIKRGTQNIGVCNVSSFRNLPRHGLRETVHSVWQKVQNREGCKHNRDLENVNVGCSQFYNESKKSSTHEKHLNAVCCVLKSDSALKKQTNSKLLAKTKRKNNLRSKLEFNNHYRNGCVEVGGNSDMCKSSNMQHDELFAIPKHMNGETRPDIESTSHSKVKFGELGSTSRRVGSTRMRRPESLQAGINEAEPLESCYASTSNLINHTHDSGTRYSLTSSSSLNIPERLENFSDIQLNTHVELRDIKADENSFAPSYHSKDFGSGPVWPKWEPTRNAGFEDLNVHGSLSMVKIDEASGETRNQKNIIQDDLVADLCSSLCAESSGSAYSQTDVKSPPLKNVVQVEDYGNRNVSIVKEYGKSANCFTPGSSNQQILTPDKTSSKLCSAVIDSYRAQVASEAILLATGIPIAEFEKFLHSASPVICTSLTTVNCQKCSHNIFHAFLCEHEVPNISLGKLWQWYEKHGNYGLEVKVDCENSCRLGIDSRTFRAYFVPYLSAIQLFTKSKDLRCGSGIPAASATEKAEMVKSSEISNISHLLSLLVPQPRESESLLAPEAQLCFKPSSGSFIEDVSVSPADSGRSDELEILFEYFESDQPQRRRPLYDMINELVRGNASSRGKVLGDGAILNSVSICDLHPESWIPEGNFRAAFLTYHSLGHLVQRQTVSDSACMDASVVSPVVGLQSYNTQFHSTVFFQHSTDIPVTRSDFSRSIPAHPGIPKNRGECWFQQRHSKDVVNSDPARILKERLRTLEQTASLMARAVIAKGNETTVNRQPDYEFFLSRQSC